uniref:Integrase catalytic region n=1 Tax=uncultured bacterium P11N2 TaxID=1748282 RepID=A0A0U3UIK1_9BACT|nr:integrase catalytic region [uncultured bacterium P11N2]
MNEKGLLTLKPGITLEALQSQAKSQTDLAAAQAMQQAKHELFARFVKPKRRANA